jgi:dipeptidyl aminopeptidase/acylaminoacyl peptidase
MVQHLYVNVDGYSSIFTKELRNGKVQEITNLSQKGVIEDLKLSADGKTIGIMMTTPITPSDIYVINVGKDKDNNNKNNIQKISHSLLGNIPESLLIRPDLIRYKSFDGLEASNTVIIKIKSHADLKSDNKVHYTKD